MKWSLLADSIGRPGWYNMALDQWLLREAERTGEGFLRLYRWDPHCLSFGRNEPVLRRYDRALIEARSISTVRRPTGGRAVWHARELTYSVAAPATAFGDDPTRALSHAAFVTIHTMLLYAVRHLGVSVSMAPTMPSTPIGAGACFASTSGGELMVGTEKILGSAQAREGNSFLQHGSLLLEDDQRMVADLTLGPALRSTETTLQRVTGRKIGFAEASASIATQARRWPGEWGSAIAPDEAALAPYISQFKDPDWTWRR